jgi:nucleotide-binding universal stress UspA family protein
MQALKTETKVSFKNILFLTDFSEASNNAMAYAIGLAQHYGATMYPAHACDPIVLTESSANIMEEVEENERVRLENLARQIGTGSTPLFARGSVEAAVPGWIEQHNIDLIVMGTHGRKGISHFLLGSAAEGVFRHVTCPVLTIGPHVAGRKSNAFNPERILLPTDLGEHAEFAAEYAISVAQENHADVTFMHVVPVEKTPAKGQQAAKDAYAKLSKVVAANADRRWNPVFVVESGDPVKQLVQYAENEKIDLIVLGLPAGKKFNGHFRTGVTYNLVANAPCPVLTLRDVLSDD